MANDQGELSFGVAATHEGMAREAAKRYIRECHRSIDGAYFDMRITKSPVSGRYQVRVKYNRTVNREDGE